MDANRHTQPAPLLPLVPIQPTDKLECMKRYREKSNAAWDRDAYTTLLAFVGGHDVVALFTNSLTNEFKRKLLLPGESAQGYELLVFLGFLAHDHDDAYEFLLLSTDPVFWERHWSWDRHHSEGADGAHSLAGVAIQCLAISGRKEAMAFYESFRRRPKSEVRSQASAVDEAVYLHQLVNKLGHQALRDALVQAGHLDDLLGSTEDRQAWNHTAVGREWEDWRFEVAGRRGLMQVFNSLTVP